MPILLLQAFCKAGVHKSQQGGVWYSLHAGIFNIDKLVNQAKRQPVIAAGFDILTFAVIMTVLMKNIKERERV